jgi:hypothetical protein
VAVDFIKIIYHKSNKKSPIERGFKIIIFAFGNKNNDLKNYSKRMPLGTMLDDDFLKKYLIK